MPTIPVSVPFTGTSVEVLNAIRNSATQNYKNFVPKATPDAECIKSIGSVIMQDVNLQNEFLNALVNRIGRVIITSKMYKNPWAMFKKGMLEYGETIEEIFVNLAKPFTFNPELAETTVFKREIPDVKAAFHIMNYQKMYKQTIANDQLRQAFLTWQGITDLIAKIVDAMYTSANYDEFLTMKYLMATHILSGHLTPITIPAVASANMSEIVAEVKGVSNRMEFMSPNYNMRGVMNLSLKNDQFVIVNSRFDAKMSVEVLATAFNMEKAEFMGHRVLVDGFGDLDNARLGELFGSDPTYVEITAEQKTALNTIPAIIVDRDWFMVYDNFTTFTEQYNAQGLYWNYFYHVWKTFSISPFANNAIFIPATPTVTSVTVSPNTASVSKNQRVNFSATVATTNFASKAVDWSINSTKSTIDNSGNLLVGADETASTITVTATSVADPAKKGTATVTIV